MQEAWNDLPKSSNGTDIVYSVREVSVPAGYTSAQKIAANGDVTITNSHTPATVSKTVTKAWSDNNDQDGIRPSGVQVQLYNGITAVGEPVTLNTGNSWTYTWSNLPKYNNGQQINYTVREVSVPDGYTSAQTTAANGAVTITNSHTPATVERTVTKVWNDNNNAYEARTRSVQVQLYADNEAYGEPVTLSGGTDNANSGWTYTWTNLPQKKAGKDITYTVKEVSVPTGYTAAYTEEGTTFTITNTFATVNIGAMKSLKANQLALSEVSAGRPCVLAVCTTSSPNHYVTVIGYTAGTTYDNVTIKNFIILDPATGTKRYIKDTSYLDKSDRDMVWIVLFSAFGTDIFAYFGGVAFGKHKLCPKISPKKTIEGSVCGILGAMLLCGLIGFFFIKPMLMVRNSPSMVCL